MFLKGKSFSHSHANSKRVKILCRGHGILMPKITIVAFATHKALYQALCEHTLFNLHSTDKYQKETETQRGYVTCPRPHSE